MLIYAQKIIKFTFTRILTKLVVFIHYLKDCVFPSSSISKFWKKQNHRSHIIKNFSINWYRINDIYKCLEKNLDTFFSQISSSTQVLFELFYSVLDSPRWVLYNTCYAKTFIFILSSLVFCFSINFFNKNNTHRKYEDDTILLYSFILV